MYDFSTETTGLDIVRNNVTHLICRINSTARILSLRLARLLDSHRWICVFRSPSQVRLLWAVCTKQYERRWCVVFLKQARILNTNNLSIRTDVCGHGGLRARHGFGTSYISVYAYLVKSVLTQIRSYCREWALTASEDTTCKTTSGQLRSVRCYFYAALRTNVQIPRDTMRLMTSQHNEGIFLCLRMSEIWIFSIILSLVMNQVSQVFRKLRT